MDVYPKNKAESAFEEERDRLHLQMISAVSHDLKTPLASVIGSLEILEKMKHILSEEKKETLVRTAIQEAYRLDGFISNILDMAKLDNGMVKPVLRPYSIRQIIADTIQKLGSAAASADIATTVPEGVDDFYTDAVLLGRSLQCVLDNALKYSGPDARIRISCRSGDGRLCLDIQDSGPNIPPQDHETVFDKYTRLSRKDYQNASTGLGLTLCRAMVTLLGGKVFVNATPPQGMDLPGACFTIDLPYRTGQ